MLFQLVWTRNIHLWGNRRRLKKKKKNVAIQLSNICCMRESEGLDGGALSRAHRARIIYLVRAILSAAKSAIMSFGCNWSRSRQLWLGDFSSTYFCVVVVFLLFFSRPAIHESRRFALFVCRVLFSCLVSFFARTSEWVKYSLWASNAAQPVEMLLVWNDEWTG